MIKKEAEAEYYKIIPVRLGESQSMLEGLLPSKGFGNRGLTMDELWMIGLVMIKSGQLMRFRIKGSKGDIVRMGYPE